MSAMSRRTDGTETEPDTRISRRVKAQRATMSAQAIECVGPSERFSSNWPAGNQSAINCNGLNVVLAPVAGCVAAIRAFQVEELMCGTPVKAIAVKPALASL